MTRTASCPHGSSQLCPCVSLYDAHDWIQDLVSISRYISYDAIKCRPRFGACLLLIRRRLYGSNRTYCALLLPSLFVFAQVRIGRSFRKKRVPSNCVVRLTGREKSHLIFPREAFVHWSLLLLSPVAPSVPSAGCTAREQFLLRDC